VNRNDPKGIARQEAVGRPSKDAAPIPQTEGECPDCKGDRAGYKASCPTCSGTGKEKA